MGVLRNLLVGSPVRARVVPFLIFAGLTLFQGLLGPGSLYWVYLVKTILGAALIALVWGAVPEMRWAWSWQALVVGVGVFVIWVGADPFYPHLETLTRVLEAWARRLGLPPLPVPGVTKAWNPGADFGAGSPVARGVLVTRLMGSSLVVPPLEEVFYRSFLYRYLAQHRFLDMPLRQVRWTPFLVTAVVFGLGHREWLAGILCGLAYQWLACRRGRLGEAITAHTITNLLLGLWVVGRGQWQFW